MKTILAATIALAISTPAFAQPKPLTVLEVLNVAQALRQLGDYPEVANGVLTGKTVSVPYRFGGAVLMTMAMNISVAENIQKQYQATYNNLAKQYAGEDGKVPPEKLAEFAAQTDKAINAPAPVTLGRIKEADLCLEVAPGCTARNAIPPALLSALIPIIDR